MRMSILKFKMTTLAAFITTSAFIPHVVAAPGAIATTPLQTSASAQPNVMFSLDTSGSMAIISPEPVPDGYSYTCTDATSKIADGTSLELDVDGTGVSSYPEIDLGDPDDYTLGNTGGTTRCFDPTFTYNVNLNDGLDTDEPWKLVPYSGKYLNWYFDTSTDSGTDNWDTKDYKPGAQTRMEIAQSSLSILMDTLVKVNVGLTTFNGSNGASINVPIANLDAAQLDAINAGIGSASASGSTPLAETLRDIGRYFASGDGNNGSTPGQCGGSASTSLYLHPNDTALNTSVACDTLFSSTYSTVTDAAGPIANFCEQNFVVMMTDGVPTFDEDLDTNLIDYDQDCNAPTLEVDGYTCTAGTDVKSYDTAPLTDHWDDVAKALYEIDLRPDLNRKDGSAMLNNIRTYTIGFADLAIENSRLIQDTATQGGGIYEYASNASELTTAFATIRDNVDGQSGTAASVTFNSSTLSSQSAVYQALFDTQRWSGQLRSFPLDGFTGEILTDCTPGTDNCWYAEEKLDAQTTRNIITYNPDTKHGVSFTNPTDYTTITSATTGDSIPVALVEDLCASPDIPYACDAATTADSPSGSLAANKAYISDLIDYLRGDRTKESTSEFRIRTHKLGDIVNSSPVYVGKPSLAWPSTYPFPEPPALLSGNIDNTYGAWLNTGKLADDTTYVKDRMPIVYVAANDGMLHGFRTEQTDPEASSADAGEEVIAYIPTGTFSATNNKGLHYLAQQDYSHTFYVDLNPALSDVYINHRDTASGAVTGTDLTSREWRTVLVGGQGGGGNTMFMLDVTDPDIFTEANAKQLIEWEFSQPNLGYTYSKPTIAMMNNGRFAAIFGNGYNSNEFDGDCKAKLFVVFLDGGIDGTWEVGTDPSLAATDYMEFDTAAGSADNCNGLSSPAVVDLNGDKVADRAYAGDLHGNLWSFDLCNVSQGACQTSGWALANPLPIMTATAPDGKAQPITVKPVVSQDPSTTDADSLIIAFGTGQYLASGDIANTDVQSFYAVRDTNAIANGNNGYGLLPRVANDRFIEQNITEIACTQAGCSGDVRKISSTSMSAQDNGWFIDFDFNDNGSPTASVAGERIVVNPKIRNGTLFFNTVKPEAAVCSAGGSGWLMSVNLANGGTPLKPVFDLNNDGIFDLNDQEGSENPAGQKVFSIPAESTFLGDNQYTPDSEGNITKRKVNIAKSQREGRMSWKEIFEEN